MAPQQKRKRRRIVKMKMNEEEGPGEYDHTEELVKAWKEAVLGNLLLQHSREKAHRQENTFAAFHGKH